MRSGKSSDASTQPTVRAPKRFFYRLYLVIAWVLTKLLFRVRYIRDPRITREGGPYFVVGNHVSYLDPIFCLLALDKPVSYTHLLYSHCVRQKRACFRLFDITLTRRC